MTQQHISKPIISSVLLIILSLVIFSLSIIYGRATVFFWLNHNEGAIADKFFEAISLLGTGYMWIPIFVAIWIWKKKYIRFTFFVALFSIIIITIFKHIFLEARPFTMAHAHQLIHTAKGFIPDLTLSFPSGHTGTAFSIFFLLASITKRFVYTIAFIYAVLVAYSRIYLGEHFPIDIAGGITVAVCAIWLSILIETKLQTIYNKT